MGKSSTKYQEQIYNLAIKYLGVNFPQRFMLLKKRKIKISKDAGIIDDYGLERPGKRSLEAKLKTQCNEYIYDFCFENSFRFKTFSKQLSTNEDYAKSIAQAALQESFDEYEKNINDLQKLKYRHTNRKGKAWRDKLYELGKAELKQNKTIDGNKTLALKAAFEKLPDKESRRTEFDNKFPSIYRTFIKIPI